MSILLVALCIGSVSAFAQKTVRGSVTDPSGEPLAGVSVVTETNGKKVGTVTDGTGKYSIFVPAGATMEFSFIGFENEVVEPESDVVNVTLKVDRKVLAAQL